MARRFAMLPAALTAWLLCAALVPAARAQDVRVFASVEATTVGVDQTVQYTLEVQGASGTRVGTPEAPETEGLVLMQPYPSMQRQVSFVNGEVSQSLAYVWSFRPLREGRARIRPATVEVDGETYRTEPIELTVVHGAQAPAAPSTRSRRPANPFGAPPPADDDEDAPAPEDGDLFIRAVPSARTAYPNEQVTVEYQLFFRSGIQLRQSRLADSWDAEGFWREDLEVESRPVPRTTVEDGLRYNTIVLKRAAVFPTRAGDLRVDPLRIETEAYLPYGSGRDPFESFFSRRSRFAPVELASPPVEIDVRPLPDGAPPAFAGAVGSFRMDARVSRTDLEVGDPVEVYVRLRGTGNLATLEPPRLDVPGAFEVYDPQVETTLDRQGRRISGTKTFTYVLVPRSNGTFTLPPVAFSYFDPDAGRYRTLESDATTLRVSGEPAPATAGATASGLPVGDIAGPMAATTAWVRTDRTPLHRSPWTYAALLLPLLALAGVYAWHRHATRLATDVSYARHRRAHPLARKYLGEAEARRAAGDARGFYAALERAVLGFVGNRLNLPEQGLTRPQLDARLAAAGVPEALRADLADLLQRCERGRFAPAPPSRETLADDHDRAAGFIAALDDHARRQPA